MLEIPEVLESENASTTTNSSVPVPKPRKRPPKAVSRSFEDPRSERERIEAELGIKPITFELGLRNEKPNLVEIEEVFTDTPLKVDDIDFLAPISEEPVKSRENFEPQPTTDYSMEEILSSLEMVKPFIMRSTESLSCPPVLIGSLQRTTVTNIFISDEFLKEPKPPEVVGVIRKPNKQQLNYCSETASEKVVFPVSSTSGMLIFFLFLKNLCLSVIRSLSVSFSARWCWNCPNYMG